MSDKKTIQNRIEDERRGIVGGRVNFDTVYPSHSDEEPQEPPLDVTEVELPLTDRMELAKTVKLLTGEAISASLSLTRAIQLGCDLTAQITELTKKRDAVAASVKKALAGGGHGEKVHIAGFGRDGLSRYPSIRTSILKELLLDQGVKPAIIQAATRITPVDNLRFTRGKEA